MDTWRRRTAYYLVTLVLVMLGYTTLYHWGMTTVEGQNVTFLHSLQVVVETFTTTGFGSDAPWTTPEMNALVILMDLTGVLLIFMALPVFVFPLFEETFSRAVPTSVDDLEDHVVVCGYSPRGRALIDELRVRDREHVVVEPDRDLADELYDETDLTVVHGNPESEEALAAANLEGARALIADVDDEVNASIALAARGSDAPVITLVEDEEVADYHRYAGADEVYLPRQLIGDSLARKVTAGLGPEVDEAIEIGDGYDIAELPVQAGSELAGVTVAESGIRERTGVNVVGAWFRGEFASPPPPEARIDEQTILLVAGHEEQVERLKELTRSERRRRQRGRVIVAGHGEVGSTVAAAVRDANLEVRVIDHEDGEGVDIVGDVTDEAALREAGIEDAGTVILALGDDTETVFAALVVRELAPEVEVIARADATENVAKLYRAGADYVLALATVAGRMLASTVLDEEVISFDRQVEVVRVGPGDLVGKTIAEADVRARTGVTVIAVERDGERITDLDPDFRIRADDDLIVAGTDEGVGRFAALVE